MSAQSLETASRVKGGVSYVDCWAVEKLCKVGEALALANYASTDPELEDALREAWRNLAKLGAWLAGNSRAYQEKTVRAAFERGQNAMLHHLEELLAPILERRVTGGRSCREGTF